jgi:outer membrane receptor protein involved in Fe transport
MKSAKKSAALAALLVTLVPELASAQAPAAPSAAPPPPVAPPPAAANAPPEVADLAGDAPDPARPAPAGKGVVWGVVTDAVSKEPVLEASVTVNGTKKKVTADLDGRFRLELPPGSYELRVWYEGHKARKIQNVTVAADKVARLDVKLDPDKVVEEVVEVEVTPERASAQTQLLIRRNAAQVGDAVSAQDIAKTPDRNAADAARRVVGATVIGNKYVFVRGLGDRYTNSLLNGTPLPSPEPDRQAVPLDLFPSLILSDLTIAKTFTPDMPGDFVGGSVRINTRELPETFLFQATLNAGFNTQTTFSERPSYAGSSSDWLGVDGGARAFPKEIPDYKIVRLGPKPDGGTISADEIAYYGKKMNSPMAPTRTTSWPNLGGSVVVGDTLRLGKGQELGYIAALSYGRKFSHKKDEIIRTFTVDESAPETLIQRNDYKAETGLDQVSWGAYGTATWKPHKNHKVVLTGLHSRSSDNEAREIEGFSEERGANLRDQRLRFVSRALTFGQLAGTHKLTDVGDAVLDWNLALSHASSDEPDTRETVYVLDGESGKYAWDAGTLSGSHFFGKQKETSYGGGLDWTQPLIKGESGTKLKAGGLFGKRARTFDARRFRYLPKGGTNPEVFNEAPDQLFTNQNIGTALALEEYTRPNDSYTAGQDIYAGYLMADTWLVPRVRVIFGARVEASRQSIDSFDPFAVKLEHVKTELNTTDLLPSVAVVIKTSKDSNLRASATRTVARPQLRELSPFVFTDYFGAREIFGNPNLRRTSVYNGDLRFELFPGSGEVLALSLFYKQFVDPIEQIIIPSNQGIISFQNAKGARAVGAEIEARKGLGFISPVVRDLGLLANVTLVYSRVELDNSGVSVQTNDQRALAGQSPYVINAGVDYSAEKTGTRARVLYNVSGPRIAQVGALGLPDVFEEPRHQLDITAAQKVGKHLDLKLSAENITNAPVRFTQGKSATGEANAVNEYKLGATFTLGATLTY